MELANLSLQDYIRYLFRNETLPLDILPNEPFHPAFAGRDNGDLQRLHATWIIASHIVRGLEFLHMHGHVHRDVKPDNGSHPHVQE
jgi:serine/threonine protein kinase